MRRAVTLVEVLVVIAIIVVLTAILTPVLKQAKWSAKVTASLGNLRQLFLATKVYQSSWDDGPSYGELESMGLPNSAVKSAWDSAFGQYADSLAKSPCGRNPRAFPNPLRWEYIYAPGDGGNDFTDYVLRFRDNTVLWYDLNCDTSELAPSNALTEHFGLAVLYGGTQIRRRGVGAMEFDKFWWSQPPE